MENTIPVMKSNHKSELSKMLKEINDVMNNHLTNILTPVLEETNNINKILLNVPMISKMRNDFVELNQKLVETLSINKELKSENEELKKQIKMAYEKIQNITLEVKELPNTNDNKLPNIDNNLYLSKNKIMSNSNPIRLADNTNLDYFSNLISDDDDEDDEEDDAKIIHMDKLNLNLSSEEHKDMGATNDEEHDEEVVEEEDVEEVVEEEDDEEDDEEEEVVDEEDDEEDDEEEEVVDDEDDEEEEVVEEEDDGEDDEDDEEEEVVEEEVVEEEEDEEEDEEDDDEEEEEDDEVEDVTIDGIKYLATNTINGIIYKLDDEGEVMYDDDDEPVEAGHYKNGIPKLFD
tara:strand:- start:3328 stop:4365 length:1038 start_codon:yes stop_codon:yes gene_type:complete